MKCMMLAVCMLVWLAASPLRPDSTKTEPVKVPFDLLDFVWKNVIIMFVKLLKQLYNVLSPMIRSMYQELFLLV